ncbi:methyltransferase domain-containing protein [Bradyrhizobium septentrionale]|uniref:Methyltransferase domain-containing protein n=1 Tax=Bradyrhizobium septentrionale TaxID=1404411 RepID=A0A974A2N4_9BRAD|nr:methyltransferase domain-containing protein [Bradyrhizobium septentrionale]UGY16246.1 methyltransferase domain-containing protein [Bradyrhizobium septentrionale]UGY24880.1 methyltransferase domain-containing protein [Bradyrhizobium septentrionale]
MKILGRYMGKLGEIEILESERTGDRLYREGELFQSESSASGESRLPYVKMMEAFLSNAKGVLLLGCGGGNLATMLARQGKSVTIVDHDPVSFDLARRFFGLPGYIPCVCADFKEYLLAETRSFDGIAVDVGGPGFCFEEQFNPATCHSITALLKPSGRAILNMLVATDFDVAPDLIGGDLSEGHMTSWIFDQPGCLNRNVLIACPPRRRQAANRRYMATLSRTVGGSLALRRPRRPSCDSRPVVVGIACTS